METKKHESENTKCWLVSSIIMVTKGAWYSNSACGLMCPWFQIKLNCIVFFSVSLSFIRTQCQCVCLCVYVRHEKGICGLMWIYWLRILHGFEIIMMTFCKSNKHIISTIRCRPRPPLISFTHTRKVSTNTYRLHTDTRIHIGN